MSKRKTCPDCGTTIRQRSTPAGNPLLAHYECENRSCSTGPVYTVETTDAIERNDAAPVLRAMRDLAASIDSDAENMQEMLDALRGLLRPGDERRPE